MIDEKEIVESGYKEYRVPRYDRQSRNWQKVFRSEEGDRLYFVNIREWNHIPHLTSLSYDAFFCFECHNDSTMWIEIKAESIAEIERIAESIFVALDCKRYEDR